MKARSGLFFAEGAFELHSNFEASLRAHEQVLVRVAEEKPEAREEVGSLLTDVRAQLGATARARGEAEGEMSVEASASAEANVDVRAAAEGKMKAAENKIAEVRRFVERMRASVSATVIANAEARLRQADTAMVRGKAEIEAKAFGAAFGSFGEAHRLAQEAQLLVAFEDRLDLEVNAIPGLNMRNGEREVNAEVGAGGSSGGGSGSGNVRVDVQTNGGGDLNLGF